MKDHFEQAAELLRHHQTRHQGSEETNEGADFYHALALLAEGLHRLEKRIEKVESETGEKRPRVFRPNPRIFRPRVVSNATSQV